MLFFGWDFHNKVVRVKKIPSLEIFIHHSFTFLRIFEFINIPMLFVLEILQVLPALFFNGSDINIYTPFGIVPMTLTVGEVRKVHVPDFRTILTFQHKRRKVSCPLVDLLDSMSVNFAPLPLLVRMNIYREIEESDVRATVIGHRGSGTSMIGSDSPSSVAENTVASFKKAFYQGAEWVECDVLMTSDHELVLHHDYVIGDTPIWNMTLTEFQQKAQHKNTFDEALAELDPRLKMLVELKFPSVDEISEMKLGSGPDLNAYVTSALKIIHKNVQTRTLRISSFEPELLLRLRAADYDIDLFFQTEGVPNKFTDRRRNSFAEGIQFCSENDIQGIVTDTDTISSDPIGLIEAAHDAGLQLIVYWWRSFMNGNNNNYNIVTAIVNFDCARMDGLIVDDIPFVKTVLGNMKTCVWSKERTDCSNGFASCDESQEISQGRERSPTLGRFSSPLIVKR